MVSLLQLNGIVVKRMAVRKPRRPCGSQSLSVLLRGSLWLCGERLFEAATGNVHHRATEKYRGGRRREVEFEICVRRVI